MASRPPGLPHPETGRNDDTSATLNVASILSACSQSSLFSKRHIRQLERVLQLVRAKKGVHSPKNAVPEKLLRRTGIFENGIKEVQARTRADFEMLEAKARAYEKHSVSANGPFANP